MVYSTLITVSELQAGYNPQSWVIVDCRHYLNDVGAGRRAYDQDHLPNALYAHLDDDLSGPILPGKTSRHPLPEIPAFAARLGNWGIGAQTQVVVYDDMGGAIAGRLWWMLRYLGHDAVAVLEGGIQAWLNAGGATESGVSPSPPKQTFQPNPRPQMLASAQQVDQQRNDAQWRVVDSRAAARYRGEEEPIDPVAGHIPGAHNRPFPLNMNADKSFLPKDDLRKQFRALLGETPIDRAVFYCGSGVTACHNLLAAEHAGLGMGVLYAGSWSEWIVDSTRPVAQA